MFKRLWGLTPHSEIITYMKNGTVQFLIDQSPYRRV